VYVTQQRRNAAGVGLVMEADLDTIEHSSLWVLQVFHRALVRVLSCHVSMFFFIHSCRGWHSASILLTKLNQRSLAATSQ
jgi:hypothetical protein